MRWLVLFCLLICPVQALAERRVALVLAAEDYVALRVLENPVHDALALEDMLSGLGFEVTVETDRTLRRMRRALDDFREDSGGADVALIFFAGHGVEIGGVNYLLPIDAQAGTAAEIASTGLPLAEVQAALGDVAPIGIVLLDACREDPFGAGSGQGRAAAALDDPDAPAPRPGLGRIGRADGVLFAFSAAPGEVASDGAGENSPFTEALLGHFATPGVEVRTALTLVQQDVYDRSRGKQLPYVESGLPRLFFVAASGDLPERDRLLIAMADLSPALRAEVESLARAKDMPLAPLYGALLSADLSGKDSAARAQALLDSAESFLRFRAQIRVLSAQDPEVAGLRAQAEDSLALGAYDAARVYLAEAAKLDANARDTLRDSYRARTLSEAQTYALSAAAARSALRYDLAMQDIGRALSLYAELEGPDLLRADRIAYTDLIWDQGDLFRLVGNSGFALRAYRNWQTIAAARVAEAPDDGEFLRNHAVAGVNLGDILLAKGDLDGAEAMFQAALAVALDLSQRADAPLKWRHDVFVARAKLGDIRQGRGDLAGALAQHQAGLAVLIAISDQNPARDDLRRDLALGHDRVGDLHRFSGDLAAAMESYAKALAIRQGLVAQAPDAAGWANELAGSHDKIGDLLMLKGDQQGARKAYQAQVDIAAGLAERDPENTLWQRDLALAQIKIGNVLKAQGDSAGASAAYATGLAIRQRLVALDAGNAEWQRDLALAEVAMGDLAFAAQDFSAAAPHFTAALGIARDLAQRQPDNAEAQQDLGAALDRMGDLAMLQGDPRAAEAAFQQSYKVATALAALDPANAEYATGVVSSLVRIALFAADRRAPLQEALAILTRLQAEGRLDPAKAGWIALVQTQLDQIAP